MRAMDSGADTGIMSTINETQRLSLIQEPGMLRGAALVGQGAVDEAIDRLREGVTSWIRLGRTILLPYGFAFLAEGLALRGDRARRWPHCGRDWKQHAPRASMCGMRNYTA